MSSPPSVLPSAPRLYRHALESIFAFCALRDLARVVLVSHDWSSAVRSMPPGRGGLARLPDEGSLTPTFAASALARHITRLHVNPPRAGKPVAIAARPSGNSSGELQRINRPILIASGLVGLEELSLRLPQLSPLMRFDSLARLKRLRSFVLEVVQGKAAVQFSDEQLGDLLGLAGLEYLRLDPLSGEVLAWMLRHLPRPQQPLKWQAIQNMEEGEVAASALLIQDWSHAAEALSTLPSLTALSVRFHSQHAVFLSALPNLRTLWIGMDVNLSQRPSGATLAAGLKSCVNLTDLEMHDAEMESENMCAFLPSLPNLRRLCLQKITALRSLRCFDSPFLAESLVELKLFYLYWCAPIEFDHLHGLHSLQRLHLIPSQGSPNLKPFTPPSALFPHMQKFICC